MTTKVFQQYEALAKKAEDHLARRAAGDKIRIQVGSATCEHAAGSRDVFDEFKKHIAASGRGDVLLHQTGCTGRCSREPIVGVFVPGEMPVKYERVDRQFVHDIFTRHVLQGQPVLDRVLDESFFNRQSRVALRHNGVIDPESIEEYFHYDGFKALAAVLDRNDPLWVIDEITRSKLRGRGGGGYSDRHEMEDRPRGGVPPSLPIKLRPSRRNSSSATPTRATPAPSWTAACWKATR